MQINIVQIITIISIFQTIFITISFLSKKEKAHISNILFLIFVVIFSLQVILQLSLYDRSFFPFKQFYLEFCLMYQSSYLLGPLVYLQIISTKHPKNILKYKNLFHIMPFLLMEIFFVIISFRFDLRLFFIFTRPGIIFHGLIYIIVTLRYLKSQRKKHNINLKIDNSIDFSWFILLFFVLLWIAYLQHFVIHYFFHFKNWCKYIGSTYALILFFLMNITVFLAIIKPNLFEFRKKYSNSQLNDNVKEKIYKSLFNHIKTSQLFLDPELSLLKLSKQLNLSVKTISQIINEKQNQNFNEFINSFRIDEAKRYLNDKACKMTIQEIFFSSGFNSKSTFNSAFKKQVGISPKEYREGLK